MRFVTSWLLIPVCIGHARQIGSSNAPSEDGRPTQYYPIVERPQQSTRTLEQQTMKLKMSQLEQLKLLSYSDDSTPKQMDAFYLGLFETDGTLPSSAITTVEDGVNSFVQTELNAVYDSGYHQVKMIETNVLSQTTAASSRRALQVVTGSHLQTQLNIIFANEPSPEKSDVVAKVQAILEDSNKLMYLLTNITSRRAADDTALSRVNAIYFLSDIDTGSGTPPIDATIPTSAPVDDNADKDGNVSDIEDNTSPTEQESSKKPSWRILIPIVVAATVVLVVVALFANQHRRQTTNRNAILLPHQQQLSANELDGGKDGVNLFWDADDIFSVEAALVETSNNTSKSSSAAVTDLLDTANHPKMGALSSNGTKYNDDQSDIFSGVALGGIDNFSTLSSPRYMSGTGYDSESPRGGVTGGAGDSRSVFSFLSGFASKASTVVASNVTPYHSQQQQQHVSNKMNVRNVTDPTSNSGPVHALSPTEGGRYGGTPHSRVSSLFTFSEEDSEDLVSSADERGASPGSKDKQQQGLLLRIAPSDEEEDSVAALTSTEGTSNTDSNKIAQSAIPTLVNGVIEGSKGVENRARSSETALKIANKYATFIDSPGASPAVSPAPSMAVVAKKSASPAIFSRGTSAESDNNNCCKEAYARVCKPQESHETPILNLNDNVNMNDLVLEPNESSLNRSGLSVFVASPMKGENELARLSADEIAKELEAAEEERSNSKKVSSHWTMSMFSSSSVVESPAAATYNGNRATDLVSPMSHTSNKSEPLHLNRSASPNVIQLQWDDPNQSSLNRLKAAAFAGSVAENTVSASSGKDSAGERYTMMTGRPTPSKLKSASRSVDSRGASKERMSTKSAGNADGTAIYQVDTAEQGSVGSSKGSLSFRRGRGKPMLQQQLVTKLLREDAPEIDAAVSNERVRVHTKNTLGDGSTKYQHETMSNWFGEDDNDDPSLNDSDSDGKRDKSGITANKILLRSMRPPKSPSKSTMLAQRDTPRSAVTNTSSISGLSVDSPSAPSEASPSKQLISDLLWLEQKIASTNQAVMTSPRAAQDGQQDEGKDKAGLIGLCDSLSFASKDDVVVSSPEEPDLSQGKSSIRRVGGSKDESMSVHHSIVCRDCFAPPGKLKIVIHSTKDGPAVHTVKKGSSLEGHIFSGDLIISVDNVDTRSYSAEQVMKMMTAKTRFERKITVLHFDEETV
jgi:hypothetical protein